MSHEGLYFSNTSNSWMYLAAGSSSRVELSTGRRSVSGVGSGSVSRVGVGLDSGSVAGVGSDSVCNVCEWQSQSSTLPMVKEEPLLTSTNLTKSSLKDHQ